MFYCIVNGRINELTTLSDHSNLAQDILVMCRGDKVRLLCNATGSRIQWKNSGELTFTPHDETSNTRTLVDGKYMFFAILVDIVHKSDSKAQFISELHSLNTLTAPSIATCSTDNSTSTLSITIAGTYSCTHCTCHDITLKHLTTKTL
jgi:hypothetical protein